MPRRSGDWWLVTSHSHLLIPNPFLQTFSGGFAANMYGRERLSFLALPVWERQRYENNAVLDTKPSPFQGKGLAWILPPSYGRRCPEGAEVGWG